MSRKLSRHNLEFEKAVILAKDQLSGGNNRPLKRKKNLEFDAQFMSNALKRHIVCK